MSVHVDALSFQEGWFYEGTVRVFRQQFTLEDAIGSHAFRSGVHCSYRGHHKLCPNTEGGKFPKFLYGGGIGKILRRLTLSRGFSRPVP
jgi:hypothetical protein